LISEQIKEENQARTLDFENKKKEAFEEVHEYVAQKSKEEKLRYNYEVGEWIELELISGLPPGE
jgi:hypothetical protein